ncbi:hypothetical protein Pelo_8933 [Pelomyxa schiedti]|nr:hypothetical protein Pelo_8933 [Pelomyxa schiedti]
MQIQTTRTTETSAVQTTPSVPPPRYLIEVVASAADQFVAFACGALASRAARHRSPARLLASSPSLVEQFGREWVVARGGCREVVMTLSGGVSGDSALDSCHEVHVRMGLSPTLGVVGHVMLEMTAHYFDRSKLVGCIGSGETARRIQQPPGAGGGAAPSRGSRGQGSHMEIGKERLLMTRTRTTGVLIDIVDGRGSVVRNLFPGDGTTDTRWLNTSVYSNSRWLVLLNSGEIILWRLWLPNESEESNGNPLFTEECCAKIKLGYKPYLSAALCEHDPDVLLMADMGDPFLRHVDLKESFNQGAIVLKKDPVPISLPTNNIISVLGGDPICAFTQGCTTQIYHFHNTSTNRAHTIEGVVRVLGGNLIAVCTYGPTPELSVIRTSDDLFTPSIGVPFQRSFDTGGSAIVMSVTDMLPCSSVVTRYAITDAETDTLLALIKYHQ